MESLKLVVASDIHIHDWMPFSIIDQYGRPSRLLKYIDLANDIVALAREKGADLIAITGDVSQISTQRPRVLDVIGEFFRILSEYPTIVIPGQHDMDTKEDTIARENCILTEICKDIPNIEYYTDSFGIPKEKNGVTFKLVACPWTSDHFIPEINDIDIFLGHGLVIGTQNLDGYMFQTGFPADTLLNRFRLSIIGDVHNGQVISENNNKILIPGAPIQANWKDEPNCGIWYAEVPESGAPICQFHNIHDLRPNFYHKFVYDQEPTDLIHSRPKVKLKKSEKVGIDIDVNKGSSNVHEICEQIIDESKLENSKSIKKFLVEAFENIIIRKDKPIANTISKSIKIKNFFTIDNLELSFDEFPDSCVIVGDNGLGKTTIPEAIYWALTGNTTKGVDISDIKNWNASEDDEVRVEYTADIDGQEYTFIRTRDIKTRLHYEKDGHPYEAGSIRETQAEMYSLLGLTDDTIKLFSYFSAEKTKLFANSGDSDKNDLISQIVGIDVVDDLKAYSKNKFDSIKDTISSLETERDTFIRLLNGVENKLRGLVELRDKEQDSDREKLTENLNYRIRSKEAMLANLRSEYEDLRPDQLPVLQETIKRLTTSQYDLYNQISDVNAARFVLESNITKIKKEYKSAMEGKCPTCKQDLESEETLEGFKDDLIAACKELEDARNSEELSKELASIKLESIGLEKTVASMTEKQNSINQIHTDIRALTQSLNEISKDEELVDESLIEYLKTELDSHAKKVKELNLQIDDEKLDQEGWKWLESKLFKRKGPLVQHLNIYGSKLLQTAINTLLVNSNVKIKITDDLKLLGKFRDRKYAGYKAMSSGQKRVTDVVLMVALNNLFSEIYNLENGVLGLAVYDEILSFLDTSYIEVAKSIVDQSVSKKLLIITHDQSLVSMYDSRINVESGKDGQSIYRKSWK